LSIAGSLFFHLTHPDGHELSFAWPLRLGPDSNNSKPVGNDRNEAEGRKEVSGELVIARGDAAEILEPSEAALDDIAVLVGALVVPDALLAVGFARDDRLDFLVFEEGAKRIGIMGTTTYS
jgi:hypothetical protein